MKRAARHRCRWRAVVVALALAPLVTRHLHGLAAQRHRHRRAGRARSRAADRRRRRDLVRPGRVRRHRRLCDRLADDGAGPLAVARPRVRAAADRRVGAADRHADVAPRRPLPAAQHDRLGPVDRDAVRQCRCARPPHRLVEHSGAARRPVVARRPARDLLPDLGAGRPGLLVRAQPAAVAPGPRDPQPARRRDPARQRRRRRVPRAADACS